jgi:hypothetical protein
VAFVVSLILGVPVIVEFFQTGLVERFPTAILASSLAVIAALCVVVGTVLSGVLKARREALRLSYLRLSPPPEHL